jgi:predicted DNA-binding protein (UPF0278 family)
MDGFLNSKGELAIAEEGNLLDANAATEQPHGQTNPMHDQFDDLIRAAAELKGQQMVMPELVIRELASRMTYEDLPEDIKAKVKTVKETANPKYQPAKLATDLLDQWRTRQSQPQAA